MLKYFHQYISIYHFNLAFVSGPANSSRNLLDANHQHTSEVAQILAWGAMFFVVYLLCVANHNNKHMLHTTHYTYNLHAGVQTLNNIFGCKSKYANHGNI